MSFTVTDLGTANNNAGKPSQIANVTIGSGKIIVVAALDNSTTGGIGGSVDDGGTNTYTGVGGVFLNNLNSNGSLQFFVASNSIAITNATLEYTPVNTSVGSCEIAALYITDSNGSLASPLDSAVTTTNFGNSSNANVTSGTPGQSGEIFVAAIGITDSTASFTQASGWGTPPDKVQVASIGTLAGGNKVNSGSSAQTYNPTTSSASWAAAVIAFKPVVINVPIGISIEPPIHLFSRVVTLPY